MIVIFTFFGKIEPKIKKITKVKIFKKQLSILFTWFLGNNILTREVSRSKNERLCSILRFEILEPKMALKSFFWPKMARNVPISKSIFIDFFSPIQNLKNLLFSSNFFLELFSLYVNFQATLVLRCERNQEVGKN